MKNVVRRVTLHPLRVLSIDELVDIAEKSRTRTESRSFIVPEEYLLESVESSLHLDLRGPPPRGAVKCATFGEVSPKLPCGSSRIVAKQTMESARETPKRSSNTNGSIPMVGKDQLAHLGDEITCLMWAAGFMKAVTRW